MSIFNNKRLKLYDIEVKYKDIPVESITITKFVFYNAGKETIEKAHLLNNSPDRVHFEIPSGDQAETVRLKKYKSVNHPIKTKSLDTDAVFSKFKTNQFAFNFFLKKNQFDPAYRVVKNRTIKNPDGNLPGVTVTARRK